MDSKAHWESIYEAKATTEVSWYQERPAKSLELIRSTGFGLETSIIDVGGGASTLVDFLLEGGYRQISVLDVSSIALEKAKKRLGRKAGAVTWIEADVTHANLSPHSYDIWHDRAVFHFLTSPEDRRRYTQALASALKPGGRAVIATFALDGPPKCSGLEVVRYSPETLAGELGPGFKLINNAPESHRTPFGTTQSFNYCCFRKV